MKLMLALMALAASTAVAYARTGQEAPGLQAPPAVAASARAIARSGARPARLTTPMRGVRQAPFAGTTMWVVDSGQMDDSSLCGTGGCDVQFWLRGLDGRHAKIFDRRVLSYAITGATTTQPVLKVDYHGAHCGKPGNAECTMAYRWKRQGDAAGGRLIVEPADSGRGVLAGPLIAAVPPDRRRVPPIVAAALADLARQCRARGGRSHSPPDELPDLDGDGRAEWATGGAAFICAKSDDVIEAPCAGKPCPLTIFGSAGGAIHSSYSAIGMDYLLWYEPTRTRLLVTPSGDASVIASAARARPLVFAFNGTATMAQ